MDILSQEEEFWSVKSRYNWLIQGDRNTRFFHISTLIRRKRNKISCLKDDQGNWVRDEHGVVKLVRSGFVKLFSSNSVSVPRNHWVISCRPKALSQEEAVEVATLPTC